MAGDDTQNSDDDDADFALQTPSKETSKACLIANGAATVAIATWLQQLLSSPSVSNTATQSLTFFLLLGISAAAIGTVVSVNQFFGGDFMPDLYADIQKTGRDITRLLAEVKSQLEAAEARLNYVNDLQKTTEAELHEPFEEMITRIETSDAARIRAKIDLVNESHEEWVILWQREIERLRALQAEIRENQSDSRNTRKSASVAMESMVHLPPTLFAASILFVLVGMWRSWALT